MQKKSDNKTVKKNSGVVSQNEPHELSTDKASVTDTAVTEVISKEDLEKFSHEQHVAKARKSRARRARSRKTSNEQLPATKDQQFDDGNAMQPGDAVVLSREAMTESVAQSSLPMQEKMVSVDNDAITDSDTNVNANESNVASEKQQQSIVAPEVVGSENITPTEVIASVDPTALLPKARITNAPKVSLKAVSQEEIDAKNQEKKDKKQSLEESEHSSSFFARLRERLHGSHGNISVTMAIVALGVVYGDIGTSPLYTAQTFVNGQGGIGNTDRDAVLGMLSLVFWSITLITTVKYVLIAMRIDNKGEGGIFSLYSLVRKYGRWLAVPAMIGGAAFLADSVLTPAVSISSAVEGLATIPVLQPVFAENDNLSLMITILIVLILFSVQSRGTERIGRVFGTVVMSWFVFLFITGLVSLSNDWTIISALNPLYGIHFLFSTHNVAGLAVMGTIFLATTGAEALYSDMGHVGRGNIYVTWPFIKVCLLVNYFGQGAWIVKNQHNAQLHSIDNLNPFFQMLNPNVRIIAVILSVAAGVIASQALISGAFTMVSEATSLNWMPHLQIRYPARTRGQLYIPAVNLVVCVATLAVLLIFRSSEHIAAAYGLALTITMIMTTSLLSTQIWFGWKRKIFAILFAVVFASIELMFLLSSMAKFFHGGWFTMLLTLLILSVMYTWDTGTKVERSQRRHMSPKEFLPALHALHADENISYFADNLVYLTSDPDMRRLDTDIFFSIFAEHPKRARAWWAVSVQTTDSPYTREYSVENFGTNYLFRVRLRLGFKVDQNVATYLHQVMHELIEAGELKPQQSVYPKVDEDPEIGTIRYVLIHKALMPESKITTSGAFALKIKYAIRHFAGSPSKWFGLAPYNPIVETLPLFVSTVDVPPLKRVVLRKTKKPYTLKAILKERKMAHHIDGIAEVDQHDALLEELLGTLDDSHSIDGDDNFENSIEDNETSSEQNDVPDDELKESVDNSNDSGN